MTILPIDNNYIVESDFLMEENHGDGCSNFRNLLLET